MARKTEVNNLEAIATLQMILNEEEPEIVLDDKDIAGVNLAINALNAIKEVKFQIRQLYKDIDGKHDDWSNGLRKGMQMIEMTISENI